MQVKVSVDWNLESPRVSPDPDSTTSAFITPKLIADLKKASPHPWRSARLDSPMGSEIPPQKKERLMVGYIRIQPRQLSILVYFGKEFLQTTLAIYHQFPFSTMSLCPPTSPTKPTVF